VRSEAEQVSRTRQGEKRRFVEGGRKKELGVMASGGVGGANPRYRDSGKEKRKTCRSGFTLGRGDQKRGKEKALPLSKQGYSGDICKEN